MKRRTDIDVVVGRRALRIVQIDQLKVDPRYQRELVPKHRKIAAEYDPDALGIPLVGQREDESLWIVDGQQRIGALKILGRKEVRVEVFRSEGVEHEAKVFKLVNQNRTKLRATELFHAMLTSGDEECHAIKEIVDRHGYTIPLKIKIGRAVTQAKQISAINALQRIYKHKGAECLEFVLNTIKKAWPDDPTATRDAILLGLGVFWVDMEKGQTVDQERLIPRLQTTTPIRIMGSVSMIIGSIEQKIGNLIAQLYRKTLRNKPLK